MKRLLLIALLAGCTESQPRVEMRSCGHAHNDEERERPLVAALELEFCSVEVDVHLVGDQLLVAHDLEDTTPERTLEALYLEPLAAAPRPIFLLIDVKSEAESTWTAIDQRLSSFALDPVRVVITGAVARDAIANAPVRRAGIDGRVADLEAGVDPELFPIISDKWIDQFTWIGGLEPMPPEQRIKLRELAEKARASGHRLRFWQTADRTEVWQAQIEAGVDLLNADDYEALTALLRGSI